MAPISLAPSPRALALAFGAYFVLMFTASWLHAQGQPWPWYGADTSRWVYAAYLLAALTVLLGLGVVAAVCAQFLNARLEELAKRIGASREIDAALSEDAGSPKGVEVAGETEDTEIDRMIEGLHEVGIAAVREAGEGSLTGELVATWEVERRRRKAVLRYLGGPAAAALVILSISGAMLPAAAGFLQAAHQVNTALILALSYSWAGLGGYALASIYGLLRS